MLLERANHIETTPFRAVIFSDLRLFFAETKIGYVITARNIATPKSPLL